MIRLVLITNAHVHVRGSCWSNDHVVVQMVYLGGIVDGKRLMLVHVVLLHLLLLVAVVLLVESLYLGNILIVIEVVRGAAKCLLARYFSVVLYDIAEITRVIIGLSVLPIAILCQQGFPPFAGVSAVV